MNWWYHLPIVLAALWVLLLGLMVGSFLNVVIVRLPYEKSVAWPGSRCGHCLRPIRIRDNLPVLGYLLLGGRCRFCKARFSPRYLCIELGTGLAFLALFLVEVVSQGYGTPDGVTPWHYTPGLKVAAPGVFAFPPLAAWVYFLYHAALLAFLIAAAVIDAEHRIIPPQVTYVGTVVGLVGSTLLPWPWPTDPSAVTRLPAEYVQALFGRSDVPPQLLDGMAQSSWSWAAGLGKIPTGAALWPFAGPPPAWAPPGSWQLGLLNGLIGAAAGMFVGRAVKFLFEFGMKKDALGLGDADLLMMAGAFLGWQPAVLALPMGAVVTLPVILPLMAWGAARGRPMGNELPFGPGIAAGVVVTWLGWPWLGELARVLFDPVMVGVIAVLMGGGMLVAGLLLRRTPKAAAAEVARV